MANLPKLYLPIALPWLLVWKTKETLDFRVSFTNTLLEELMYHSKQHMKHIECLHAITCFEQPLYISTPGCLQPINCQNVLGNYKVSSTTSCAIQNYYTVLPFCEVLYIQMTNTNYVCIWSFLTISCTVIQASAQMGVYVRYTRLYIFTLWTLLLLLSVVAAN